MVEAEFEHLQDRTVFELVSRESMPQGVEVGDGIVLVEANPQLAKQWCFLIVRHLPKHLQYVVKLMQKSEKDLAKKPPEVEDEVRKWDSASGS